MEIKILGSGCVNCKKLEENAQKAIRELQVDSTIIKVQDIREIMIAITDKIFNDTVSVSNNSKIMQDEGFRKALGESLIEIGKTKEGIEVLKTIGHKGYDWAD